jgi:hypothetical protein
VALALKAASQATSAPASKQQTYIDKTLTAAKAKQSGTVAKAKQAGKKVTAEAQSAVNAINDLLK